MRRESANTEDEERSFNQIKSIANQATNRHNNNILSNIFIRIQMEAKTNLRNQKQQQSSEIGRLWKLIDKQSNTRIGLDLIEKHEREWQAHLERIADYLIEGKYEQKN